MKLYERLARLVKARENCAKGNGTNEWFMRHSDTITALVKEHMPSGSGFDAGTMFDWDKSRPERLVFNTSFHHMDEYGGYDGWTDHDVIVTPSLAFGFNLRITGRDRNGIKDYMSDVFNQALDNEVQS